MMTLPVVFGKNEGEREAETLGNLEEISSSLEFKRAMLNSFRRMAFLIAILRGKEVYEQKFVDKGLSFRHWSTKLREVEYEIFRFCFEHILSLRLFGQQT